MNTEELATFIKQNSKVEELFMEKCLDYLNAKNQKRQPAKRWNEARVLRQAEKMYASLIESVQSKLAGQLRSRKVAVYHEWKRFINENEVLDSLEESMGELEFE